MSYDPESQTLGTTLSQTDSDSDSLEFWDIDYDPSDSEEIEDGDFEDDNSFVYERDRWIYPNDKSKGYQSSKNDRYYAEVKNYKYDTNLERSERFKRREILANKNEAKIFLLNITFT